MEKESNYKIVYVVPFFGKLREDIDLWLHTCAYNPTIDFIVVTDDKSNHNYPNNVKVIYEDYTNLRDRVNTLYGIEVALEKPYKLCDLKPAYGEIFSEYLTGYDFWGHCDMDMLWGNIRSFITDDILDEYDKIGFLGHSTLYRNTKEVNSRYKLKVNVVNYNYIDVFETDASCHFDEAYMNLLYKENGWKIYDKVHFADLTEYHYNFYLTNVENNRNFDRQIFLWKDGVLSRLYLENNEIKKDSFMYIHFLKRKMVLKVDNKLDDNGLLIAPNYITNDFKEEELDCKFINKAAKPRWIKYFITLYKQKKDTITLSNLPKRILNMLRKYYLLKGNNESLNDNEKFFKKDTLNGKS